MRPHHIVSLLGLALLVNNPIAAAPRTLKSFDIRGDQPKCHCLPTESCWPSASTWSAFNDAVGGNLIATTPAARECHDPYYNEAKCDAIKKGYHNVDWRSAQPGAMVLTNWETFHGQGCLGVNRTVPCNQGAVSIYSVKATSVSDVQQTVRFASKHNVRLTVKNTGHDYLGRSAAPSSINLWVRSMKKIEFTDNFVPKAAPSGTKGQGAVILESGVVWGDAYKAATRHNVVIVGGVQGSVGTSGGYCLSGGHSPLSPHFGLCVDNVLQYTVVTADGEIRTANSHQNRDLFWALRGGGPGFGVVVEAVYRTHPAPKNIVFIKATITTKDSDTLEKITRDFYSRHDAWSNEGWSGYALGQTGSLRVQYFLPDASVERAKAGFGPFIDYARSLPQVTVTNEIIVNTPNFDSMFVNQVEQMFDQPYAGINTVLSSRLLPRTLFQSKSGLDLVSSTLKKVHDDIASFTPAWGYLFLFIAGGQVAKGSSEETSVQPAWREALALMINTIGWDDSTPYNEQQTLRKKLTESANSLRAITPGGGTYQNEADAEEPNWQEAFFGANYPRLRALKDKYDPDSHFICRHCVGSEDWDDDLMCRR